MRRMAKAEARPASMASSSLRSRQRELLLAASVFLAPGCALYGLFVLWPLLQTGWLALQRWNGYGPQTFVGLANFADLAGDAVFRTSLEHSVLWDLAASLLTTLLGLGLALLIAQTRARTFFLAALFFPALLPATVVAAVWVLVYSPLSGLLNSVLHAVGLGSLAADWLGDPHLALGALFIAWLWSTVGIGALIFWTGLMAIGREYVELALLEGAGDLWRFRHVILPGLRRVGLVTLLVNTALGTQVFDLIFVTTGGGPGYATMILPLDVYGRAFGGRTGQGAAAACVQIVLALLLATLTILLFRGGGESLQAADASRQAGHIALTGMAAVLLAIFLLPLAWLASAALETGRAFALGATGPGWDPRAWTWDNFGTTWDAGLSGAVATSLLLAVGVVAVTVLAAFPAAFALTHLVKGRAWRIGALALLFAGLLVPAAVLLVPLFSLLKELRLLDTPWGILLPEAARALPFAVLVLWGFLAALPREVLEAARVDGATAWQQMIRVAAPLTRPALYAVTIWAFISSWNEYLLPTLVSQDGSLQTVPTLLAGFIGKYDTQFGLLAAGSLTAMAPALLIYLALRRPAAAGLDRVERSVW